MGEWSCVQSSSLCCLTVTCSLLTSHAPFPSARAMTDPYFARRLAEEFKLAEQARSEKERAARLRACHLLCNLLGFDIMRAAEVQRLARRGAGLRSA